MAQPIRFLNGLSNLNADTAKGALPFLDPTKYSWYYQDYFGPHLGAAISNGNATYDGIYYITDNAGAVIDVTQNARSNGVLSMTLGATDNIYCGAYPVACSMRLHAAKKFWMSTRFRFSHTAGTVNNSELFIGLTADGHTAHTDLFNAAGTAMAGTDYIGWILLDGTASIYQVSAENTSGWTVDTTLDAEQTTWYELALYYDGDSTYHLWGKVLRGTTPPHMYAVPYLGNYDIGGSGLPVSAVGPCISFKNGEAKAKLLLVDYLFACCER